MLCLIFRVISLVNNPPPISNSALPSGEQEDEEEDWCTKIKQSNTVSVARDDLTLFQVRPVQSVLSKTLQSSYLTTKPKNNWFNYVELTSLKISYCSTPSLNGSTASNEHELKTWGQNFSSDSSLIFVSWNWARRLTLDWSRYNVCWTVQGRQNCLSS